MYSKTIILGYLTRNIELLYTSNGFAIAKSSIATTHKYKAQNGEMKEETLFLDFSILGKMAEVAHQYLRRGSKVLLEGRLTQESWTSSDGSSKSRYVLKVEELKMLDNKNND